MIVLLAVVGCGDEEVDLNDELGFGNDDNGQVEVVIVDSAVGAGMETRSELEGGSRIEKDHEGTKTATGAGIVPYDPDGEFTVQVGLYGSGREAGEHVIKLSALGYPAYSIAQPDGKGVRVRIGYFKSRVDAVLFGDIFQEDYGFKYWIDRRTNEF